MSYLVLARKWRPLIFDDVVGQDHITTTLKKAIEKNRVAHAYVFTGTRGTGKTTTARILARALNCDAGPTPNPCGTCASCKSILGGSSFDVLEIDGASNNKVDDIRELRNNVGYGTMGGKYRVFVIDEVHMLTPAAFNALLKTLEEPPKNVIFIFATTEPNKIPETIHSRCQRYDFRRISTEQILQRLEKICTAEGIRFERPGLAVVARKADGSMRDGLSLLDQVYSFCQDFIGEKEVRSVLGLVDQDIYNSIVAAITTRNPSPALEAVESVLYQGFDLGEFLLGLEDHLRMLLFAQIPGVFDNTRLSLHIDSPEIASHYRDQAAQFTEGTILRMIEVVRKSGQELKWSAFPRFAVEIALLKLVFMDNTVALEELLTALKSGGSSPGAPAYTIRPPASAPSAGQKKKSELSATPVEKSPPPIAVAAPPVPAPAVMAVPAPVVESIDEEVNDPDSGAVTEAASFVNETPAGDTPVFDAATTWPKFIDKLMQDRPNLGSFLSFAYIFSSTPTSVDLKYPHHHRFQFSQVTRKESRDEIVSRLHDFARRPVELHITIESESKDPKPGAPVHSTKPAHRSIADAIEREPIVETVLEVFDGEIIT